MKHNMNKTFAALAVAMLAAVAAPMATADHSGCPTENMVLTSQSGTIPTYKTSGEAFAANSAVGSIEAERIDNLAGGTWRFTALLDKPVEDAGAILGVRVLEVDSNGGCIHASAIVESGTFQADGAKDYYFEVILEGNEAQNVGPYEFTATLERTSPV